MRLHVDHVLPISAGGKSEPDNLVTSCEQCNLGKGPREGGMPPSLSAVRGDQ